MKMVEIFGNWGRIRTWIDKRIRIKDSGNLFAGEDSGKVTTGERNNFLGYQAGYNNTSGHRNNFLGYQAGYNNTGDYSTFLGYQAGYNNTSGHRNNFLGYLSGYSNTTGNRNSFLGYQAGYTNVTGERNNFLGCEAGYYETGSNKLFIDNQLRANENDGRIKALIYGIFDAATANQILRINGILELTAIKSGATQAGAGAGANEVWKTASHVSLPDNVLMIGV